jgi:hypothetical protein
MNVNATYPLNVAARAAQMKEREFRRHVNNGFVKLQGYDRKPSGSGDRAGYSRRRILQAAIMKRVTGLGLPASIASAAALQFSDVGQTGRAAGDLFEHGKTLLIICHDGATVQNSLFDASLADVSRRGASLIIADLNKIVDQVDAALNS